MLLASRICKMNRKKNLPPCRGRVGAPWADRFRPVLTTPRRLVVVLQSCNNQCSNTGSNYITRTKTLFTPFRLTLFLSSINHFISSFSTLITPYPTKFSFFSPEDPVVTKHSITQGRMEREMMTKLCCTITFIGCARCRLQLHTSS